MENKKKIIINNNKDLFEIIKKESAELVKKEDNYSIELVNYQNNIQEMANILKEVKNYQRKVNRKIDLELNKNIMVVAVKNLSKFFEGEESFEYLINKEYESIVRLVDITMNTLKEHENEITKLRDYLNKIDNYEENIKILKKKLENNKEEKEEIKDIEKLNFKERIDYKIKNIKTKENEILIKTYSNNLKKNRTYVVNLLNNLLNIATYEKIILLEAQQTAETISITKGAYNIVAKGARASKELRDAVNTLNNHIIKLDNHVRECINYLR